MRKQAFLAELRKGLAGLPQGDMDERVSFYSEMIDDRMEEGLSEEEAVAAVGAVESIAAQILADIPPAKEKNKPKRRMKAWEITLLVLGSPIWLSLLIAAFAVILSLYISLWAVIISLWAAFSSLLVCALACAAAGIGFVIAGNGLAGAALIGAGLVCAGLSVFLFFGCKAATKGTLLLVKKMILGVKSCLKTKEGAQ